MPRKRIVPDFMRNNPDDTFVFLMPLDLQLNQENYGNSSFNVLTKNLTTDEEFIAQMTPEIFFTHFQFFVFYENGSSVKTNSLKEGSFNISTSFQNLNRDTVLSDIISDENIEKLFGYKTKYLDAVKKMGCYIFPVDTNVKVVVPYYAIAIFYYFRSSEFREAVLNCKLDMLYTASDCDPKKASLLISRYMPKGEAPFIHRFVCQEYARGAFENMGKYLHAYCRRQKDLFPNKEIETVPINASFPFFGDFTIYTKYRSFWNDKEYIYFVGEIIDDNIPMACEALKILVEQNKNITKIDSIEKLQKLEREVPQETTEILKVKAATKRYTHKKSISKRKRHYRSLDKVKLSEGIVQTEEVVQLFKIYENLISGIPLDNSLIESSLLGDIKIRRLKASTEYEQQLQKQSESEYTDNFEEFKQYAAYLQNEPQVKNFMLFDIQKIHKQEDVNGHIIPKTAVARKDRQYITATFEFNKHFFGLLELQNAKTKSLGTWVIVSKSPVGQKTFHHFLDLYISQDKCIQDIKKMYPSTATVRFYIKNHTRTENLSEDDIKKWVFGVLGKTL
jgi:hypothetical protein